MLVPPFASSPAGSGHSSASTLDVLIRGGGPVGTSLALALSREGLKVGLLVGRKNRQDMLINAVAFDLTNQRFCSLAQCGPAHFRNRFTFADRFMTYHAIRRALF